MSHETEDDSRPDRQVRRERCFGGPSMGRRSACGTDVGHRVRTRPVCQVRRLPDGVEGAELAYARRDVRGPCVGTGRHPRTAHWGDAPGRRIRADSGTVQRLVGPVDLARFDSTVKVPTEGSGMMSRHPGRVPVCSLCAVRACTPPVTRAPRPPPHAGIIRRVAPLMGSSSRPSTGCAGVYFVRPCVRPDSNLKMPNDAVLPIAQQFDCVLLHSTQPPPQPYRQLVTRVDIADQ